MEKLEILLSEGENSFLVQLRMNDVFDEKLYQEIKQEMLLIFDAYKGEKLIPKYLLPLMMDVFIFLAGQSVVSKRNEDKINMAIDELSEIIRNRLIEDI